MSRCSNWKNKGLLMVGVPIVSLLIAVPALAYDVPKNNATIIKFLTKFDFLLHSVNLINYLLRQAGWLILLGLAKMVDLLGGTFAAIATVGRFYKSAGVTDLADSLGPLAKAILTLVFVFIGLFMILGKKIHLGDTFMNLFTITVILICLPLFMNKAMDMAGAYVGSENNQMQSGTKTVLNNVQDIYYFAHDNFKHKSLKKELGATELNQIDITEVADPDIIKSYSKTQGKYMDYGIQSQLNEKGGYENVAVKKGGVSGIIKTFGLGPMFGDAYYRYTWHFWTAGATLVIEALVLFLSAYKAAGIMFDLAWNKIFAGVLAYFDVRTMQRFKRLMEDIFSSIAVLVCISTMLSLYSLGMAWINKTGLNEIAKVIMMLAFGMRVINGPESVVRILGVDAGIKDGWNLIGGALGLKKAGEVIGHAVKGLGGAAVGAAAFAAGAFKNNGGDTSTNKESGGIHQESKSSTGNQKDTSSESNGSLHGDTSNGADNKQKGNVHGGDKSTGKDDAGGLHDNKKGNGQGDNNQSSTSQKPKPSPNGGLHDAAQDTSTEGNSSSEGNQSGDSGLHGSSEGDAAQDTSTEGNSSSEGNQSGDSGLRGSSEGDAVQDTSTEGNSSSEGNQSGDSGLHGSSEGDAAQDTSTEGNSSSEGNQSGDSGLHGSSEGDAVQDTSTEGNSSSEGNPNEKNGGLSDSNVPVNAQGEDGKHNVKESKNGSIKDAKGTSKVAKNSEKHNPNTKNGSSRENVNTKNDRSGNDMHSTSSETPLQKTGPSSTQNSKTFPKQAEHPIRNMVKQKLANSSYGRKAQAGYNLGKQVRESYLEKSRNHDEELKEKDKHE